MSRIRSHRDSQRLSAEVLNPLHSASWLISALNVVGFSYVARIGQSGWGGLTHCSRRGAHLSIPMWQRPGSIREYIYSDTKLD